jgi:polysaccharide deacetylase 2 family uncharacterized protein YibQ/cell division protein FtsB
MSHKKKKKSLNNLTNHLSIKVLLLAMIVILSAISSFLFIQTSDLKSQNKELKEKITQIEKNYNTLSTHYNQLKDEKDYLKRKNNLNIEYTNNNDESYQLDTITKKPIRKFVYEEFFEDDEIEIDTDIEEPKEKIIVKEPIKEEKPIIQKEKDKEVYISNKPKLAIIIDDVTSNSQIKKIQNIGYTVNIAILPPTSRHPNSAKIAKKLDHYMVHLPLQASSYKYDEENTLYINDTLQTIEDRILAIKKLYPRVKYINNHTGSKFTENTEAMDKLLYVLKNQGITFVDSRTTAKSVVKEVAKKYNSKVLSRNIFLDNKKDFTYIQKQLKKAIKVAKKRGYAIAIGHPFNITFETLKESKHLLKDLELVYVHRL